MYAEWFDSYLADADCPVLSDERSIFRFFVKFWRAIHDDYTFTAKRDSRERHPFADLETTFLLVNRAGIFRVSGNMEVTSLDHYCAIGSGAPYAWGALRALYDGPFNAVQLARRAVEIGIDFNVYCGGDIDMAELNPLAGQ